MICVPDSVLLILLFGSFFNLLMQWITRKQGKYLIRGCCVISRGTFSIIINIIRRFVEPCYSLLWFCKILDLCPMNWIVWWCLGFHFFFYLNIYIYPFYSIRFGCITSRFCYYILFGTNNVISNHFRTWFIKQIANSCCIFRSHLLPWRLIWFPFWKYCSNNHCVVFSETSLSLGQWVDERRAGEFKRSDSLGYRSSAQS